MTIIVSWRAYGFTTILLFVQIIPDPANGIIFGGRMALELCGAFQAYLDDIGPVKPQLPYKINGNTFRSMKYGLRGCGNYSWNPCSSPDCTPFSLLKPCGGASYKERAKRSAAPPNGHPWVVVIRKLIGTPQFYSTGTLIHPQAILWNGMLETPTPTKYYDKWGFFAGGNNRQELVQNGSSGGGLKHCKYVVYPWWNPATGDKEFGVTFLRSPIQQSESIKVIELAKHSQKFTSGCRVASWTKDRIEGRGWAASAELSERVVKFIPEETCAEWGYPPSVLCTEPVLCGKTDKGAPMVCSDNGTDVLYAIGTAEYIDRDDPPGLCHGHSMFVKVAYLSMTWFEKELKKAGEDPDCKEEITPAKDSSRRRRNDL